MSNEQYRYLFIVRHQFNEVPHVDSFYELKSPSGLTGDQLKVMTTLKPGWEAESLKEDTVAYQGMSLRLRFNADMYPKVCLVKSTSKLTYDALDTHISIKYKEGLLEDFLKEAEV